MVTCDAIQSSGVQCGASEQVTPANHKPNLNTNPDQLANLQRQLIKYFGIYAKSFLAREGFTAELCLPPSLSLPHNTSKRYHATGQ